MRYLALAEASLEPREISFSMGRSSISPFAAINTLHFRVDIIAWRITCSYILLFGFLSLITLVVVQIPTVGWALTLNHEALNPSVLVLLRTDMSAEVRSSLLLGPLADSSSRCTSFHKISCFLVSLLFQM
jgi:hypothetical protein